jgi:RimJ/RimL family protein N-acetyltransferase
MTHEALPADHAALLDRLTRRIEMAMFPLANLQAHGLAAGRFPSDDPQASRFWLVGEAGVVALSRGGMLMALATEDCDLAALRPVLSGLRVEGAVGPAPAVRPLLSALGLADRPCRRHADEPAFALALSDLRCPDPAGAALIPATEGHRPLLTAWRAAYHRELLSTPPGAAEALAARDVDGMIARGRNRLLVRDGQPLALTGFNAALPGIVQVGGVYVPPALRGRGHARLAVALHLDEVRGAGVARAVLFAASPAAARAYQAIGFRPNGRFALVLFADAATIAP